MTLAGGFFFMLEITRREPSSTATTKANFIGNLVSDLTSIQKWTTPPIAET